MGMHFAGRWRDLRWWQRELPPVMVVGGLMADYMSPAALWTVLLPLASVAALVALRQWGKAALVVVLSSWIVIPTTAGALCALDEARGVQTVYAIDGATPAVDNALLESCAPTRIRVRDFATEPGDVVRSNRFVGRVV